MVGATTSATIAPSSSTATNASRVPVAGPSSYRRSPRRGALDIVVVALDPRHEATQLAAGLLDRVRLRLRAQRLELRRAGVLVVDEPLGERAAADLREHLLHAVAHVLVDDARTRDVVAVLGGVGHRPALLGDAALVHEVDDELQLVEALEVGDLGLVAGLGEDLEARHDERRRAAAEDSLLAEEVGLGLLGERGLDAAGAQAADRLRVGERERPRRAGRVLLDRDDHGDAATVVVLTTDEVTRTLRGDHGDVDAGGRRDVAEADVEAVAEEQGLAVGEVRLDRLDVERLLLGVRSEDH